MSASRISVRYAKALFKLCESNPATAKERLLSLGGLSELFKQEEAGRVLRSPAMPNDLKEKLVFYALDKGNAVGPVKAFFSVVVNAGRARLIPEIIDALGEIVATAEGRATAKVKSAVDLPAAERDKLTQQLSTLIGKKIDADVVVDKSLLGGFVATVGNYLVDMSLKSKLDRLAQNAAADL